MEFLDPIKKRQRSIRLNIGHLLMAALVVIGTYVLVLRAQGYDIDRKSGEVIQNALVFVDSAPDAATIKINNEQYKDLTNTRMALPDGSYKLELNKAGYRGWQREFSVIGGSVERFTYPVLFPEKLASAEVQTFDGVPTIATESPDRKWVLLGQPGTTDTFTQYNLGALTNRKPAATSFKLPAGVLTEAEGAQSWQFVEWSSDNRHVLLRHIFTGGQEFILVDRDDPTQTVNINRQLAQNPTTITLRDKRFDQLYLHNQADLTLKTADLKTRVVTPLLNGVLSYKSHGGDRLLYSTVSPAEQAKARIFLKTGNDTYVLRDIPVSASMPLEIAQFNNHWYIVIGSDAEQKVYIYKDPQNILKLRNDQKPAITAIFRMGGPLQSLSFSNNTRMIMANSGQHFNIYDIETKRSYGYNITDPLDIGSIPLWMDGHRLLIRSAGNVIVFDYDGINKQILVPSDPAIPVFFDRDYEALYSLSPSLSASGKQVFGRTELRVLPK